MIDNWFCYTRAFVDVSFVVYYCMGMGICMVVNFESQGVKNSLMGYIFWKCGANSHAGRDKERFGYEVDNVFTS